MVEYQNNLKKESNNGTDFKSLTNYLGLISALIVSFSILKTTLYYNHYNIPIKYFISISEISVLVSEDIVKSMVFFGPLIFFDFIFFKFDVLIHESSREVVVHPKDAPPIDELTSDKIWYQNLKYSRFKMLLWFFYFGVSGELVRRGIISGAFIFWIVFGILSVILLYFMQTFLSDRLKVNVTFSKKYFYAYSTFLLSIIFAICLAYVDIRDNKEGKYIGTSVITNDKIYLSGKEQYYLGKTEKYVFFYNQMDSASIIIKADDIKEIIIKKKP